jgi:ceramide glucosyltransferase
MCKALHSLRMDESPESLDSRQTGTFSKEKRELGASFTSHFDTLKRMLPQMTRAAELIAVAGTLSSMAYYAICLWSAATFRRQKKFVHTPVEQFPRVSILKPLRGVDPGMYESFRTHCLQNYPEYEIIFAVSDPDDEAIGYVKKLQREFPLHSIQLVVCAKRLGTNVKVSNLAQMLGHARGEYLIVNDSDIRVPADYLRNVIPPLLDSKVGLVTCLYRGVASPTIGSRLEALGIATDFCPGVLSASLLQGIQFGLGSTLAFRRHDLISIGGFEAIADHLADDYEIGNRIAGTGLKVVLSETVVESFLPAYSFGGFLKHQLRWARTLRGARPWGYLGLIFTFGIPWALLALALSRGAVWAWILLAVTLSARFAVAISVGHRVLDDRHVLPALWLVPIREVIAVFVWLASFAGGEVSWRGDRFRLKNGKLIRD